MNLKQQNAFIVDAWLDDMQVWDEDEQSYGWLYVSYYASHNMMDEETKAYYKPERQLLAALSGHAALDPEVDIAYLADLIGFEGRSARIQDHENVDFLHALRDRYLTSTGGGDPRDLADMMYSKGPDPRDL
jgi:hypothetical protein